MAQGDKMFAAELHAPARPSTVPVFADGLGMEDFFVSDGAQQQQFLYAAPQDSSDYTRFLGGQAEQRKQREQLLAANGGADADGSSSQQADVGIQACLLLEPTEINFGGPYGHQLAQRFVQHGATESGDVSMALASLLDLDSDLSSANRGPLVRPNDVHQSQLQQQNFSSQGEVMLTDVSYCTTAVEPSAAGARFAHKEGMVASGQVMVQMQHEYRPFTLSQVDGEFGEQQQVQQQERNISSGGLDNVNNFPIAACSSAAIGGDHHSSSAAVVVRCEICDEVVGVPQFLLHSRQCRHRKRLNCEVCGEEFNEDVNLVIHNASAHENRSTNGGSCLICAKHFSRGASLRAHLTLHRVEDDVVVCCVCKEEFEFVTQLKRHERLIHSERTTEPDELKSMEDCHLCAQCGVILQSQPAIKEHKLFHRRVRESLRPKRKSRKPVKKPVSAKKHMCGTCGKSFLKLSTLKRHGVVHTGEKAFKCSTCDKNFSQKGALMYHEATHAVQKPYKCTLCGFSFAQNGNLKKHVKRAHAGTAETTKDGFPCPHCPCVFTRLPSLQAHLSRRHVDEDWSPAGNTYHVDKPLGKDLLEAAMGQVGLSAADESFAAAATTTNEHSDWLAGGGGRQLNAISEKLLKRATDRQQRATNLLSATMLTTNSAVAIKQSAGDGIEQLAANNANLRPIFVSEGNRWRKLWPCPNCDKAFSKGCDLVRHMRRHSGEKPYNCPICSDRFALKATLRQHMFKESHLKVLGATDLDSNSVLSAPSSATQCPICRKALSSTKSLSRHLKTHNAKERKSRLIHLCQFCNKCFSKEVVLNNHMKHKHRSSAERASVPPPAIPEPLIVDGEHQSDAKKTPTTPRRFACHICRREFGRRAYLNEHLMSHRGLRQFRCRQCGREFVSGRALRDHLRRHAGLRTHVCRHCFKAFVTASALRRHAAVHSQRRPFACPFCGRLFKLAAVCRRHIRERHAAELPTADEKTPPFACAVCDAVFGRFAELVTHFRDRLDDKGHSEKLTRCSDCDEVFEGQILVEHWDTYHADPESGGGAVVVGDEHDAGNKGTARKNNLKVSRTSAVDVCDSGRSGPAEKCCGTCGRHFNKPSDLTRHERTHTGEKPFACGQCGRRFRVKSTLVQHEKVHNEQRCPTAFVCSVCRKVLMSRNALKVHVRLHTNERPYACRFCDAGPFLSSGQRVKHVRKCHKSLADGPPAEKKPKQQRRQLTSNVVMEANEIQPANLPRVGSSAFTPFNRSADSIEQPNLDWRGNESQTTDLHGCKSVVLKVRIDDGAQQPSVRVDVVPFFDKPTTPLDGGSDDDCCDYVIDVALLENLVANGALLKISLDQPRFPAELQLSVNPEHLLLALKQYFLDRDTTDNGEATTTTSSSSGAANERFFVECLVCGLEFSGAAHSERHFRSADHETALVSSGGAWAEDGRYGCECCAINFATQHDMEQHRLVHTRLARARPRLPNEERLSAPASGYVCRFCSRTFSYKWNMMKHVMRLHTAATNC